MNKAYALDKAIEITKEYARGGGATPPQVALRNLYEELKKLNQEVEGE